VTVIELAAVTLSLGTGRSSAAVAVEMHKARERLIAKVRDLRIRATIINGFD
jgi:hypothetical protein